MTYAQEMLSAKAEGKAEGIMKTVLSLFKKNRISEKEAAEESGITVEEFRKAVSANM